MFILLGNIAKKSHIWPQILNTLMPGGKRWAQYAKCLESCPGWAYCRSGGPDGLVCTTKWQRSETNPLILRIVRHVLQNFAYYDRGDSKVENKETEIKGLLTEINRLSDSANEEEYEEGNEKLSLHRYCERNSKAVKDKKNDALSTGHLRCEACGVDYIAIFSEMEALRVVECHHRKPLSGLKFSGITKHSELALLCANCHRLAHSKNPPLSVKQVRDKQASANKRLSRVL